MESRFAKFTERARRALSLAQEEACQYNHNYIGTEHLLLALLRDKDGVATRVLETLQVDLDKVRSAVEYITGHGDKEISGEIGLTPRSKKIVELAVDESRRWGHTYIGTEHLLIGVLREGEGVAAGVLFANNVSLDKVRDEVRRILSHQPKPANSRPPWDDYWYQMAKLVSSRSTCPRAACGCVIVSKKNRVLSTGYNGSMSEEDHCVDVGCDIENGHCKRSIHAEMNAVMQDGVSVNGGRAYVYRKNNEGGSVENGCCADCTKLLKVAGVELVGCWDE